MDDMILVSHFWAHVLFDIGATHSFISMLLVSILQLDIETCMSPLVVSTLIGNMIEISMICKFCGLVIREHKFFTDLYILLMPEFHVILGMDWITKYNTIVDCQKIQVILCKKNGQVVVY